MATPCARCQFRFGDAGLLSLPSSRSTTVYATEEEAIHAVGEALRVEYLAIVEAGFLLRIDDPFMTDVLVDPALDEGAKAARATMYVEATNRAIRGIPPERVRLHT